MGGSTSKGEEEKKFSSDRVLLNVYQPTGQNRNIPGFGIYHSGVEVYDTEYTFAGGSSNRTGVFSHRPKKNPDAAQWTFKETVDLGACDYSKKDVKEMIGYLSSQFAGNTYHLTSRNCNHFSEALCRQLGVSFPSWVNRAAKVGDAFSGLVGNSQPGGGAGGKAGGAGERGRTAAALGDAPSQTAETVDLYATGCLDVSSVACLNETRDNNVAGIFPPLGQKALGNSLLESDCDEQLLLFLPFLRPCKLVAVVFHIDFTGDSASCPKTIKLFKNCPNMDFDNAVDAAPTETILLQPQQQGFDRGGINVNFVKWQDLSFLTIFVEDNFGGETTKIHHIGLVGKDPAAGTTGPLKKMT
eukprot:CAMPEP_0175147480 /NCGR_PEP_ID=MMETSP0087-20121206/16020_1 /TAXON_ID=136419 /ORGANISM="Unknown Unknown, Strain D1" /LENGTH=355 /DNA_ID=CAMNT_0016432683 /DNA_START=20 /DNA_END=1088 /DNA_ORIENTATION=+